MPQQRAAGIPPASTPRTECDVMGEETVSNLLNPIFALTAPRTGVLSYYDGLQSLEKLLDVVDDKVYHLLEDAWRAVGVPANGYWSRGPEGNCTPWPLPHDGLTPLTTSPHCPLLLPDPRRLRETFYGQRIDAIARRGYETNSRQVVVAIDRINGRGSKLFNVLPRYVTAVTAPVPPSPDTICTFPLTCSNGDGLSAVAAFIEAIPRAYQRNLYVLIDEGAAVDPFFDIDFSYAAGDAVPNWWPTRGEGFQSLSSDVVEEALCRVLDVLKTHLELKLGATVEECLVLTSSVQVRGARGVHFAKLSFHVHFRLQNRQALASVKEMHGIMCQLRAELVELSSSFPAAEEGPQAIRDARLVLQLVDFGVYSKWRAFRLPYCIKSPLTDPTAVFTLADAAADDLLVSEIEQSGIPVPRTSMGSIAESVMHDVVLSDNPAQAAAQWSLLQKLLYMFRFLVPIVPGSTLLSTAPLKVFLEARAPRVAPPSVIGADALRQSFASAVIDLACVQRDSDDVNILRAPPTTVAAPLEPCEGDDPFGRPMPPLREGVRVPVHDCAIKSLIVEVFACLSPHFNGPAAAAFRKHGSDENSTVQVAMLDAGRLSVHYSEGIRAFYVMQKQSKYCLRLDREHKATYAQLYLTYGSIKVRCYANDCCARCTIVPWEAPMATGSGNNVRRYIHQLPDVPGYPRYERLRELRAALFPDLPLEELVRTYGTQVLDRVRHPTGSIVA